jgi:hypothetical protein
VTRRWVRRHDSLPYAPPLRSNPDQRRPSQFEHLVWVGRDDEEVAILRG